MEGSVSRHQWILTSFLREFNTLDVFRDGARARERLIASKHRINMWKEPQADDQTRDWKVTSGSIMDIKKKEKKLFARARS